jgi:hypothetical protein
MKIARNAIAAEFADMLTYFKRQRFDACTPDAPHEPTASDAWTDALIADLETLQNAAVDDGPMPKPKATISVDDMRFRIMERDRLAAMDTRTDAERWLGDPPKHRSALAMKKMGARG